METALEVLVANDTENLVYLAGGYTPTPVVSHAILAHNGSRTDHRADGVVISPSHNPPEDGGIKYNPPSGGPAMAVGDDSRTRDIDLGRVALSQLSYSRPASPAGLRYAGDDLEQFQTCASRSAIHCRTGHRGP